MSIDTLDDRFRREVAVRIVRYRLDRVHKSLRFDGPAGEGDAGTRGEIISGSNSCCCQHPPKASPVQPGEIAGDASRAGADLVRFWFDAMANNTA